MDKKLGKAIAYGVYDLAADAGWVSVGTDADTAQFAVDSLRTWWSEVGRPAYPDAISLLITADSGGNGPGPLADLTAVGRQRAGGQSRTATAQASGLQPVSSPRAQLLLA
jgi:hypothetical protein